MQKTWGAARRLYSVKFPTYILATWRAHEQQIMPFLRWFLRTKTYHVVRSASQNSDAALIKLLQAVMLALYVTGVLLVWGSWAHNLPGFWAFGLATILSTPLVVIALFITVVSIVRFFDYLFHPKRLGRAFVAYVLEQQVIRLRLKHRFTVVAVAGSVGKTSTKLAVAELLGQHLRVQYQAGNYNDRVTVPLVFFGLTQPSLLNPFAWMRTFGAIAASLHHPYPYDVVVIELGTDGPGQMARFAYARPDLTVLTAISPEHMAFFGTLDAVAAEESSVFDYSHRMLVNTDLVAPKYLVGKEYVSYSQQKKTSRSYYGESSRLNLGGQFLQIHTPSGTIAAHTKFVGLQGASSVLAAAAVADLLGLKRPAIAEAIESLTPFAGRMQVLDGLKGSKVIDDTYNASPVAVKAALDVLYGAKTKQRIAVLGSMNELGNYSKEAHIEVGDYCDPKKLDLVLTLGRDAQRWLAPAARDAGCVVRSFTSQVACAAYVRKHMKQGAVVLAKGSQNGVFAEEVVKQLLAHPADARKLVRQSPDWLRVKAKQAND